jgi:hypothetical protein
MTSFSQNIDLLTSLQSTQLIDAVNQISGTTFNNARLNELMNTITSQHSDTGAKIYNDFLVSNDSLNSLQFFNARNTDLNNVQNAVLQRATSEASAATSDSQVAKRQFEINEWSANNKAESIFLMQLLLIGVTVSIMLLFLNRIGVVPMSIFIGVASLLLIAFILTVVIRAQYTNISRNSRYWNRRNYGNQNPVATSTGCSAPAATIADNIASEIGTLGQQFTALGNAGTQFISGLGQAGTNAYNSYQTDVSGNKI